jgi:ribonuclease HII
MSPSFEFEDLYSGIVCGIDEVGRGPLAGPVVAAAVIIKRDMMPAALADSITDSKKISAAKRKDLFQKIYDFSDVAIAECSVDEIDKINILQASLLAMKKACESLREKPDAALIDGNKAPLLSCATRTIIGGDNISLSIAAASIVAKHRRDMLMAKYAEQYPHYGWERNAGYGTAAHLKAIETHGITPLHRRSFAPIRKYSEAA